MDSETPSPTSQVPEPDKNIKIDDLPPPSSAPKPEQVVENEQGHQVAPVHKMGLPARKKFGLLLWKNYLLQVRNKWQTAFEIILPLIFVVMIVIVRRILSPVNIRVERGFPANGLTDIKIMAKEASIPNLRRPLEIWYAPDSTDVNSFMEKFLNLTATIIRNPESSASLKSFPSEDQMLKAYKDSNTKNLFAGVIFNKFEAGNIDYTLRLNPKKTNKPKNNADDDEDDEMDDWFTHVLYPLHQRKGARVANQGDRTSPGYREELFLLIQYMLDATIIRTYGNFTNAAATARDGDDEPKSRISDYELFIQKYPYPTMLYDDFVPVLSIYLPLVLMLSYIYTVVSITRSIVIEKEKRLKETMKMMGLPNYMHWAAWFIKSYFFLMITSVLVTVLLCARWYEHNLAVLTNTNPTIVLLFLLCYDFAIVCLAFFMSTLMSRSSLAAVTAGIVWFVSFFPTFYLEPNYDSLSSLQKVFTCIVQNLAMSFGCIIISLYESNGIGATWENINVGPQLEAFSLLHCMLLMILYGILFFLLAIYIEGVWPGEYGVPLPWYFPVSKAYWFESIPKTNSAVQPIESDQQGHQDAMSAQDSMAGVRILALHKRFGKKIAVKELTLDMYEDQITALLGHNGAGKSTTMSMLTGLIQPTSGTAIVNGYDITTNMKEVRASLGICPQHDVLFDEMTVEEHLIFFSQLKGQSDIQSEVDRLIEALGLEPKRYALSRTLSGGMKRKLSVGIALIGDSKVVLLDEPTAGMDPGARRLIWDLLSNEKKGRTILLSTHFMDEADLLGDRIAIMSEGELQTVGTSLSLKKKYGGGYHLIIVKKSGCDVSKITAVIQKHLGEAKVEQDVGAELSYSLPDEKANLFGALFEELEKHRDELKIDSYGAGITTMEEVFMKVIIAAEEKTALKEQGPEAGALYGENPNTISGPKLIVQQFRAMFVKKALYAYRNRILILLLTLLPILFLIIGLIFARARAPLIDDPPLKISLASYGRTETLLDCKLGDDKFCDTYRQLGKDRGTKIIESDDVISDLINAPKKDLYGLVYRKIIAMQVLGKRLVALYNTKPYHAPPAALNYMTTTLFRSLTNQSSATIDITNYPFPFKERRSVNRASDSGLLNSPGSRIGFCIAFGMSFFMAGFTIFVIKERETNFKHLQFVSGVKFWIFWLSGFLFDAAHFLIPCCIMMLIFLAFQQEGLTSDEVLSKVFILLMLFGWASIPLMYLLSFFFKIPSNGFLRLAIINVATGMVPTIAFKVLRVLEKGEEGTVTKGFKWAFMIFPQHDFEMAFNNLYELSVDRKECKKAAEQIEALNITREDYCDRNGNHKCCNLKEYLDWEPPGIRRYWTVLAAIGLVCWIVLVLIDSKIFKTLLLVIKPKQNQRAFQNFDDAPGDTDVAAEAARIQNTDLDELFKTDNLILRNLKKRYGKFLAVKGLNLGVQQKECFGLLGVNGAGKTTTFKMLTGDIIPTSGDAYVCSHSVTSNIKAVQRNLGYCPQFDALLEELTGRETIRLFARLRGIPEKDIDPLADKLAGNLIFVEHLDKPCGPYSGGNKRKLSTAVALIGSPPIVFLDEPTTGMDPVARRHLWNCISKVRDAGASIVITSHSMEECEALCTRLVVMVDGEFRCLGSIQHLKSKFGEGYTIIAQMSNKSSVKNAQSTKLNQTKRRKRLSWEAELQPLQKFIKESFPGAELKDIHPRYVHYHVSNKDITWDALFRKMEEAKKKFGLEAYSVGQTSLEQVFLNFAKDAPDE